MTKLNPSTRLKRLLEAGHLPEELPPPFVSHPLGRYRKHLLTKWAAEPTFKDFQSRPEPFSVPRYGTSRRRIVVVNPINHFKVSRLIADNWKEVKKHISQSKITEFRPIIDASGNRSIFPIDFSRVDGRILEILSQYDNAFQTDVTRFYASIYTHSISWALYGKGWVKSNLKQHAFTSSFGNRLDAAVRHGQENQSIGIPIGPDTSRIISEIIAVGLEKELANELSALAHRSVRYVDDLIMGFDSKESVDKVVSALEAAMSHYELDINISKTKVIGVNAEDQAHWISELRACRVRLGDRQRNDLERFFRLALVYAEQNEKDAVLKYAIKYSRSFSISSDSWPYYCQYLIRVSRKSLACLPALAQVLIEAKANEKSLHMASIEKFVLDVIENHAPVGHAFEVSWALFICKGLGIKLEKSRMKSVFLMDSSICALLCMDLDKMGLIVGGISDDYWLTYATPSGLESSMWLLSYEAALKNWWSTGTQSYAASHPLFGPMLSKNVYFYDVKKNVRKRRAEMWQSILQTIRTQIVMSRWEEYF